MTTDLPKWQAPKPKRSAIQWLLDSDPSIRWQVMRDLTDASDEEIAAERAKIATNGWGATLLAAAQSEDMAPGPETPAFPNAQPCALYYCCMTWGSTRLMSKLGALFGQV